MTLKCFLVDTKLFLSVIDLEIDTGVLQLCLVYKVPPHQIYFTLVATVACMLACSRMLFILDVICTAAQYSPAEE